MTGSQIDRAKRSDSHGIPATGGFPADPGDSFGHGRFRRSSGDLRRDKILQTCSDAAYKLRATGFNPSENAHECRCCIPFPRKKKRLKASGFRRSVTTWFKDTLSSIVGFCQRTSAARLAAPVLLPDFR